MQTMNVHAAETHLSRLIDDAAAGEEIIIARAGKPVARLAPLVDPHAKPKRTLGAMAGKMQVAADFDSPLPDEVPRTFDGA